MNKLTLSAFMIAGLTQATGCIITSDDPHRGYGLLQFGQDFGGWGE